jgi:diaminopimelate epimerase
MTEFLKMHGLGNDFIILDRRSGDRRSGPSGKGADASIPNSMPGLMPVAAARRLSDRRFGIGCDQILLLSDAKNADIRMDILNHDGSGSAACGNGTRCVADLVMGQLGTDRLTIETDAGILPTWKLDDGLIAVDMGKVSTDWHNVPLAPAVCHSLGNPHAVVFVKDAETVDLARLGPLVETSPLFPERVNLSVVNKLADGSFRLRVWERGVGITMACGSGACAVGVAIVRRGLAGTSNKIVMDGGAVNIDWNPERGTVVMSGPVAYVCRGELSSELDDLLGARDD